MPQDNRNELELAARRHGFTRDTLEKVVRLKEILGWINDHPFLNQHLALKGGTAINLTIFDLPRLSVDIDLDFTPNESREDMMANREVISTILRSYMESEGYTLSPASRFHHSLDAFLFTYRNAADNMDLIKVEINYSLRAHIFPATERTLTTDLFGGSISIQTVDPVEIYAAKINALLSRAAARDLYDLYIMASHNLLVDKTVELRKSVVFYASISRDSLDVDFSTEAIDSLSFQKIKRDLFPVLSKTERQGKYDLEEKKKTAKQFINELMILSENEKEYVHKFRAKEYRPELLFDDASVIERIREHPMALWKCR